MQASEKRAPFNRQLWHFILHLRWHYQLFILSGGYLMGGFFQDSVDWPMFGLQFLNVHLLLFGGATAYNSWWDKDEGPIGGLKHPPKMESWMWGASLALQFIGGGIALVAGMLFTGIYLVSMLLFWLYSTPHARWKGTPVRSLVAIGVSTGTNSFLLGYLAAGGSHLTAPVWIGAGGVALVILSLYPVSQIYQIADDLRRGDRTFAAQYGATAVFRFFRYSFAGGIILLSAALLTINWILGTAFLFVGAETGYIVDRMLGKLTMQPEEYGRVMKIKYGTSLAFVLFLLTGLAARYALSVF